MVEGEQKYKQSMESLAQSNQSLGSSAGKLGDQIKDLSGKLGINLPDGAAKALNGLNGFSAGTVAAMGAAAAGVAAMIKVCKELHEITLQAAADADELITQSMVTGLSTRRLQELKYAENLIDVPVSTITASMKKLNQVMYEAQNGNKAAAESFAKLGVTYLNVDGSLRDVEGTFEDVIDALGAMENPGERNALVLELMGRNAQELNPLILQGSDAIRKLAEEAEAAGYVLDESQIQKLGEVDDAYQRMQLQIEATQKQLAVEFAPASKAAMETFGNAVEKAGKILVDTHLIENIGAIVQGVMGIIDAAASFTGSIPGWMGPIEQFSNALRGLAIVASTVADFMTVMGGLLPWNWGSGMVKQGLGMGDTESYTQRILNHNRDTSGSLLNAYNAGGTDNWRGGLTWVGEAGPELVRLPQHSQILSNQESRALAGGDQHIVINVQGIQQLDEVVCWYESRRVRERMR